MDFKPEKKHVYKKKKVRPVKKAKEPKAVGEKAKVLDKKKLLILCAAVVAVLGIGAAVFYFITRPKQEIQETTAPQEEEETTSESPQEVLGVDVLSHLVNASKSVEEAYKKRPAEVELTEENTAGFADITACSINPENGRVELTMESEGIPSSDDKFYYLFGLNTYETEIGAEQEPIQRDYKNNELAFSFGLNKNSASSRLYQKFVVAVKKDEQYIPVSNPMYITNPEAIAQYSSVFETPKSKKGLLIDPAKLHGDELDDLGVKQAAYNIPVSRILGPSTNAAYPTIHYSYNGKSYSFNGQVISEYDFVFSTLTAKGITTTAILLNNYPTAHTDLIHPTARGGTSAPYVAFNGATQAGVEYMAAIGSFLADRYSGSKHGRISNWVIANEINARKEWNYMEYTDVASYVEEYAKAFRVFYTSIKSVSSSARVYISLDQQWDRNLKNNPDYDGRDILDEFNRNIKTKGNISWGLAQHPYNVPLTESRIWKASKYVSHTADSSMMSMANIEVLINYMNQADFLTSSGEVRSIMLTELGYTSQSGEALQAAAFAYAYYKVEAYKDIDGLLFSRETDAAVEVADGLAFGLNHADGVTRKQLYTVFKYIDTSEHETYTDFAKPIIGITSWQEIIR